MQYLHHRKTMSKPLWVSVPMTHFVKTQTQKSR